MIVLYFILLYYLILYYIVLYYYITIILYVIILLSAPPFADSKHLGLRFYMDMYIAAVWPPRPGGRKGCHHPLAPYRPFHTDGGCTSLQPLAIATPSKHRQLCFERTNRPIDHEPETQAARTRQEHEPDDHCDRQHRTKHRGRNRKERGGITEKNTTTQHVKTLK